MNKMIQGIHVLEQIPIRNYTLLERIVTVLGISIIVIYLIIFIIQTPEREIHPSDIRFKRLCIGCGLGFAICILSLTPLPCFYAETGKYTYRCKLEDHISANDLSERFNIISVEDGIWTIEEK